MPAGDGGRLNHNEGLLPPVPQSPQAQPEQTVARVKTSVRTSEDAELVPQGHHLESRRAFSAARILATTVKKTSTIADQLGRQR